MSKTVIQPYQIYQEITNIGKNIEGSKKKVRWTYSYDSDVKEIILIHSVITAKRVLYENGRELVTLSGINSTHLWKSAEGLFMNIINNNESDNYFLTINGVAFEALPKKSFESKNSESRKSLKQRTPSFSTPGSDLDEKNSSRSRTSSFNAHDSDLDLEAKKIMSRSNSISVKPRTSSFNTPDSDIEARKSVKPKQSVSIKNISENNSKPIDLLNSPIQPSNTSVFGFSKDPFAPNDVSDHFSSSNTDPFASPNKNEFNPSFSTTASPTLAEIFTVPLNYDSNTNNSAFEEDPFSSNYDPVKNDINFNQSSNTFDPFNTNASSVSYEPTNSQSVDKLREATNKLVSLDLNSSPKKSFDEQDNQSSSRQTAERRMSLNQLQAQAALSVKGNANMIRQKPPLTTASEFDSFTPTKSLYMAPQSQPSIQFTQQNNNFYNQNAFASGSVPFQSSATAISSLPVPNSSPSAYTSQKYPSSSKSGKY